MQKRFEDALMARIDAVVWKGFSSIERWELQAWYSMDRISKTVWRDLQVRFAEAAENESADLYLYETETEILLIHSDGLVKLSPSGEKIPIEESVEADA